MSTISISATTDLEVGAEAAWAVVADYGRDAEWRSGVESMTPTPFGPVRVGTTTVEHMRFAGKAYRNDGEVLEVDPGRSFRWRTVSGAHAHGSRSVESLGAGRCRVTLELHVTPSGIEALMAPLLARMLRKTLRGDVARLAEMVAVPGVRQEHPVVTA